MTREQLEHAIRAACEVSEDSEIWIFGSQAILGEFPDAPEDLRASIEIERISTLRIDEPLRDRLVQWVQSSAEEL